MANICTNRILFTGTQQGAKAARLMITENEIFSSVTFQNEFCCFTSEDVPPIKALREIADTFGIGFILNFRELHTYLFGEATYENSIHSDVRLTATDFAAYHYDQELNVFVYLDTPYESEASLIELLFEEKKKRLLILP